MRLIGHLAEEAGARTFGDYLYVQGVENNIEEDPGHGWAIWIVDEDKIAPATEMLTQFRSAPGDPKYRTEAKGATRLRAQEEKSQAAWEKRLRQRRHLFRPLHDYGFGVFTYALIVISAGVFLFCRFGMENERVSFFYMTAIQYFDGYITYAKGLPEIRHGELWRLFTPMFVHMHFLHILLNMLWLRDLGSMVEARQSRWILLALVLGFSGFSNLVQYAWNGPNFGGMSGVVYGLLGYIWVRGKFDPGSGLYLHQSTVIMMLVWLAFGFTGLMSIANGAHLGGLVAGLGWGYLSSLRYR
jgi:GlpG protein